MSRYALIEAGKVVETREMASNFDSAEVAHKFDFRIVSLQSDPVFDSATHKLLPSGTITGWVFVVNANDVEATRKTIALTRDEIDANTETELNQTERDQAKAFYQALKAGTATNNQVQRVVARLLKDAYTI